MSDRMARPVGLIGLGLVGSALAELLLARGFPVLGYDLDPAKRRALGTAGGGSAASPADVSDRVDRVVLSLPDSIVVQEVVEGEQGLLAAATPARTVIDTTTGDPEETEALAARLADRGLAYLDATLSGSSAQIRRRTATVMVGGSPEAVAGNQDILTALSDKVHHVGPAGSGARAKLASNLVLGLNRLALAEGLVFAERLGLDPAAFLALLRDTPAWSAAMDAKGERMVRGRFEPESRIRQHYKDVELILCLATAAGQALPLTGVHRELLAAAIEAGDGELDNAAIIREVRRRGTEGPGAG